MPVVIPPWLQINPVQDYLAAAKAGAGVGLERARLGTEANEAAARIGLGYAQLGQSGAESAASRALAIARLRDASQKSQMLQANREAALGLREQGLGQQQSAMEQNAQIREAAQRLRENHLGFLEQMREREQARKESASGMSDLDKRRWDSASRTILSLTTNPKYADDAEYLRSVKPAVEQANKTINELTKRYSLNPEPSTTTASGFTEGQRVRSKKTGQMGTVVNGQIIPDPAPVNPGETESDALPNMGLPGTRGFFYGGDQYEDTLSQ